MLPKITYLLILCLVHKDGADARESEESQQQEEAEVFLPVIVPYLINTCAGLPDGNNTYPGDCGRYLVCLNEVVDDEVFCPPGTYFNPATESCTINEELDEDRYEQCFGACSGFGDSEIIANPDDCTSYFICQDNVGDLQICGPGLYFNPLYLNCTVHTMLDDDRYEECFGMPPPTEPPPAQPCDGVQNGNVAHPDTCARYLVCVGGSETDDLPCPPVTYFNPDVIPPDCTPLELLSPIRYEECFGVTTPPTTTIPPTTTLASCAEGIHSYEHPETCTRYYDCIDTEPIDTPCPPNTFYNAIIDGACVAMEELDYDRHIVCFGSPPITETPTTTIPPTVLPACQGEEDGNAPDPDSCSRYVVCLNQEQVDNYPCGPSTFFNDLPEYRECTILDLLSNERYFECFGIPKPTVIADEFAVAQESEDSDDTARTECAWNSYGYYANPTDCLKYIECVSWYKKELECPPRSYYSPEDQDCTFYDLLSTERQQECSL